MSRPSRSFGSEDDLTRWLRRLAPEIGDDAALLGPLGDHAVTVDSQREGVHFPEGIAEEILARRLLAVNLSDLAAVGARPLYGVCTVAAPADFGYRRFFTALVDACEKASLRLVGGDLARAKRVACTFTAVGERRSGGRFLRRDAGRAGQQLWLAGDPGLSHLGWLLLRRGVRPLGARSPLRRFRGLDEVGSGLRPLARRCLRAHLEPVPRLGMSAWLATRRSPVAAMDVSDGLLRDLRRLAQASGVDVALRPSALEAGGEPSGFGELCRRLDEDPWMARLHGGEDYGLVFAVDEALVRHLVRWSTKAGVPIRRIGTLLPRTSHPAGSIRCEEGELEALPADRRQAVRTALRAEGWDHLG